MSKNAVLITATGQHVGKTTISLGIFSGLKKRYSRVGFLKPVGQQHVCVENGTRVDKDVVLFKKHFDLPSDYDDMSPVLFPSGFTRDFLDEKVLTSDLENRVLTSFDKLTSQHDYVLVEGTGHMGVGSIVNLNNAQVAKLLGLDVVIVVHAGIGSAIDQLSLNKSMCEAYSVAIRGVILNRVYDDKRAMIVKYISKALKRWDIPLIGCIPFDDLLNAPTMKDFENLFDSKMLAGEKYRYRHFRNTRLVGTAAVNNFMKIKVYNQLIITHISREDIIMATLEKHRIYKEENHGTDLKGGIVLTGKTPPNKALIDKVKGCDLPIIYVPVTSYKAMKKITSHVGKIRNEDVKKVDQAVELVEEHIDFDRLCLEESSSSSVSYSSVSE